MSDAALGYFQPSDPSCVRASRFVQPDKNAAQRGDAPQKRMSTASGTTQTRPKSGPGLRGCGWHAASLRIRLVRVAGPAVGGVILIDGDDDEYYWE
ncbi:hypothetical protein QYE76_044282 [Lolium multiflorum]|uniref:Uncharacterized protein n=1 Tax=Lolium multiflorum TaxID=4521 RepID=A0AAD8WWX0_LOLMU|nr:hypothetical protein QYE76_044282 [Lolium multiflorum]